MLLKTRAATKDSTAVNLNVRVKSDAHTLQVALRFRLSLSLNHTSEVLRDILVVAQPLDIVTL